MNSCRIITEPIRQLAKKVNENPEIVKNLVGLWAKDNGKGLSDIPSPEEFIQYKKELRSNKTDIVSNIPIRMRNESNPEIEKLFDENPELANSVYKAMGFKKDREYVYHRTRKPQALNIKKDKAFKLKPFDARRIEAGNGIYSFTSLEDANKPYPKKTYGNYLIRFGYDKSTINWEVGEKTQFMKLTKEGKHGNRRYNINYLGEVSVLYDVDKVTEISISKDNGKTWETVLDKVTSEQKQQAQQLYSQYLDSIFPDSQVKDIVYHGSKNKKDNFTFEQLSNADDGFYFTDSEKYAKNFGEVTPVLLNIKNPNITDIPLHNEVTRSLFTTDYVKGTDGIIGTDAILDLPESNSKVFVVGKPNQIHILGSKADIERFKSWVGEYKNLNNETTLAIVNPEIEKLFDENPELANAVYEALGFNKYGYLSNTTYKERNELIKKYKDAIPNIKNGRQLIYHLNIIKNRNTGDIKDFANLIIELSKKNESLRKLLDNPNLYAEKDSVGDRGMYFWDHTTQYSSNVIQIELGHFTEKFGNYDEIFLHELIHNLTAGAISKESDLYNENFAKSIEIIYDEFVNKYANKLSVDKEKVNLLNEFINKLVELRKDIDGLSSLEIYNKYKDGSNHITIKAGNSIIVKDNVSDINNINKNKIIKKIDEVISYYKDELIQENKGRTKWYYFLSESFKTKQDKMYEFLATFISNESFRNDLKLVPYKKSNLFNRIIELIRDIFSLTKEDTLYNEFVLTLTDFISKNDYSQLAKQTQKTAYENRLQTLEQQKQQAQQLYSQYLESLNKPNTNPILQDNQEEQVKKFTELQERLNNKEFLEGAKNAYESTPALQQFGTQEEYNDYIARVSLGITKNPSSGEYNYESQVKDIVYHGTNEEFDIFDLSFEGSNEKGGRGRGFNFTRNLEDTNLYGDIKMFILLNAQNRVQTDNEAKQDNTSYIDDIDEIVVYNQKQIHILGSQPDIQGFKEFVQDNSFDKGLAQKIQDILQKLYPEIKLNITNNPVWEQGDNVFNQQKDLINAINFRLKVVYSLIKLSTPQEDERTRKYGEKNQPERLTIRLNTKSRPNLEYNLRKTLQNKGVTNQQIDFIFDYMKSNNIQEISTEELAAEIASNYSYTIEINTAITKNGTLEESRDGANFNIDGDIYRSEFTGELDFDEDTNPTPIIKYTKNGEQISEQEFWKQREKATNKPSSYYSNLTVPGGTNYTENKIETPDITPSIQGHPAWVKRGDTDNGIGWFRSDEKVSEQKKEFSDLLNKNRIEDTDRINELRKTKDLPTKTRRILEVQSDLFQKGRDREDLISAKELQDNYNSQYNDNIETFYDAGNDRYFKIENGKETTITEEEFYTINVPKESSKNQFLQLLNKDNNWVTFFIKSIIQDSAKKGYEKVLFPLGDTASKIEGHSTLEEFKKQKEDRIKELENTKEKHLKINKPRIGKIFNELDQSAPDGVDLYHEREYTQEDYDDSLNFINKEINQLKQELERIETEGFGALRPIYNFYQNIVTNILKKQGYNPVEITDEHGNTWNEISINQARDLANILLQRNEANQIIGQANIKARTVLIDAVNQKQDTLPHEYAHHYIAWFRDTPIVQEAIKKWGSEEALVQSIGEQVVKQKGEAYDWWNRFVKWIMNQFNSLSKLQKEELTQILTDAFLTRQDLNNIGNNQQSQQALEGRSFEADQALEKKSQALQETGFDAELIYENKIKEEAKKIPTTDEIKTLAKLIQEENINFVKELIVRWRDINNKPDKMPEAYQLLMIATSLSAREARQKEEARQKHLDSIKKPNTQSKVTLTERKKVNLDFDPITRRNRVSLIRTLFSTIITQELENRKEELAKQIEEAINNKDREKEITLSIQLSKLDRGVIIKELTPVAIFNQIRDIFQDYVDLSEQERIQIEFDALADEGLDMSQFDKSFNELKKQAQTTAEYKFNEYNKILDNFNTLAEETCEPLTRFENYRITPRFISKFVETEDDSPFQEVKQVEEEDSQKESWIVDFYHVSSFSTLSEEVKKVLFTIPRTDAEGNVEVDDLGFPIYLSVEDVHRVLVEGLMNIFDVEDMFTDLEKLIKTHPWVQSIINTIKDDEGLTTLFFTNYRKDFTKYWVQRVKKQSNGKLTRETVPINQPKGISHLIKKWRNNYESGVKLDKDSVYDNNSNILKDKAEIGLKIVEELQREFQTYKDKEEIIKALDKKETLNKFIKLFRMIGINVSGVSIHTALTNIQENEEYTVTPPYTIILSNLNVIFKGIKKGEVQDKEDVKGDLINTFKNPYRQLAKTLNAFIEGAVESSVRELGKTHYGHLKPNFLGKLVKRLSNVRNLSENDFQALLEKEFGKYEWFKDQKTQVWLNDALFNFANSPKARKEFDHKVILHSEGKESKDWGDLDTFLTMLTEFGGITDSTPLSKEGEQYTYYVIPVQGDAPHAEFLKLRKYNSGEFFDKEGNPMPYDEVIIEKLINLVIQEQNRIMLVRQRDVELTNGNPDFEFISNLDILRDEKTGEIIDEGGSVFKFLPQLNNIKDFIENIEKLKNEPGDKLKSYIRETLANTLELSFEEEFEEMQKMGLFQETHDGEFVYLRGKGRNAFLQNFVKNLKKSKVILGESWTSEMDFLLQRLEAKENVGTSYLNQILSEIKNGLAKLNTQEAETLIKSLYYNDSAKEMLRHFHYNHVLATASMIQLTAIDLAYFKNLEDFQKRFKQIHSPGDRPNVNATYNGKRVGKEMGLTFILRDQVITSQMYDDIKEVTDYLVTNNKMSKIEQSYLLTQFLEVNVADAQAYRPLSSYQTLMIMYEKWTDQMENSYNRFVNGDWDIRDFAILWQGIKPFVYTHTEKDSGVEGHTPLKVGMQFKNSEFLLFAMYPHIAGVLNKSAKLRAIDKFATNYGIDVIQFESTTKTGKQGVLDINDLTSEEKIISYLEEQTGLKESSRGNPNVVHQFKYEDYGLQLVTNDDFYNHEQLVGVQVTRLMGADISDDAQIIVDGISMDKQTWLKTFNQIHTENLIESFSEVREIFENPLKLEEFFIETIKGNPLYNQELVEGLSLNEDGEFTLPLSEPIATTKIQNLQFALAKNRITKQKIKGGQLVQVSSYGLTDELKIVWEGKGASKRIKSFECYMPAYSKEFIEPMLKVDDQGRQYFDMDMLPEDLRYALGYRIPTEAKYSMVPMYIKGFLPPYLGSAVMLPADITKIADSDFDFDKLYVLLPEFKTKQVRDWAKFKKMLLKAYPRIKSWGENPKNKSWGGNRKKAIENIDIVINQIQNTQQAFSEGSIEMLIYDFYKHHESEITKTVFEKIKYDYNKRPQDNSRFARNNAFLDLSLGLLTSPDSADKIIRIGGFDNLKKTSKMITVLKSTNKKQLEKTLNSLGIDVVREDFVTALQQLDDDTLSMLEKLVVQPLNPLSPLTYVKLHTKNTAGMNMIGVYANHNSNNAVTQHTLLGVSEAGAFTFDGKVKTSLHDMKNDRGEYISKNNAEFLGASVDSVKENALYQLNQNYFTGNVTTLLTRLGYDNFSIGVLLNQPIILRMTAEYFNKAKEGQNVNDIIDSVIEEYLNKVSTIGKVDNQSFKNDNFYIRDLVNSILVQEEANKISDVSQSSDYDVVSFFQNQVMVGILFKQMSNTASALSDLTKIMKTDATKDGAGPTIGDAIKKIQKLNRFIMQFTNDAKFPLENCILISPSFSIHDGIDSLRERFYNSPIPYLQAAYTLGIKGVLEMMQNQYAQLSDSFFTAMNVIESLSRREELSVKTINRAFNELFSYVATKLPFFGDDGDMMTSEKRDYFINYFPDHFVDFVQKHPDIAELEFIKNLTVIKPNRRTPVRAIIFENVGQLTIPLESQYRKEWESMLYSEDPEVVQFAFNLFLYNFYRNGFPFGPNSFTHLAPLSLRLSIEGYIDMMRGLVNSTEVFLEFSHQFIRNNLNNRELVQYLTTELSDYFLDKEKQAVDSVVIDVPSKLDAGLRQIIKKTVYVENQPVYLFQEYIAFPYKGGFAFYQLGNDEDTEMNTAIYNRIEPLNIPNVFQTYEYGKNADEIEVPIKQEESEVKAPEGFYEEETDYDSAPEIEGYSESFETLTFDDLASRYDVGKYMKKTDTETSNESFKTLTLDDMLGKYDIDKYAKKSPNADTKSLKDIPQNKEWKDVNNEKPC